MVFPSISKSLRYSQTSHFQIVAAAVWLRSTGGTDRKGGD